VLAVVFLGSYVAGLSGHEPMLFFAVGVVLVLVELFFFPGSVAFALAGVVLMLGSLVWALADLWPSEPVPFTAEVFLKPVTSVAIGMVLAVVTFALILRFLPKGGLWGKMVLQSAVGGEPGVLRSATFESLVGQTGVAATGLFPSGQVVIGGRRYEARVGMGFAEAGTAVRVTRQSEFSVEVEVVPS
jgi:membrane-bound serine protease (ClpP class)